MTPDLFFGVGVGRCALCAAGDTTRRLLTIVLVDGGGWLHVRKKGATVAYKSAVSTRGWKLYLTRKKQ